MFFNRFNTVLETESNYLIWLYASNHSPNLPIFAGQQVATYWMKIDYRGRNLQYKNCNIIKYSQIIRQNVMAFKQLISKCSQNSKRLGIWICGLVVSFGTNPTFKVKKVPMEYVPTIPRRLNFFCSTFSLFNYKSSIF